MDFLQSEVCHNANGKFKAAAPFFCGGREGEIQNFMLRSDFAYYCPLVMCKLLLDRR